MSELLADRDGVRVLAFAETLPAPGEDIDFVEPVAGEITLTGTAGGISLRGRVRTVASCVCGTCLRRFALPIAVEVAEEFGPRAERPVAGGTETRELTAGDFLVPVETGDTIDVTEVVRQHLVLALPLAPRCRDDCPGLCPRCGADLNDGPCGCDPREVDPRLEGLRRWSAGQA
ncbi:MAG TPA: DUF177 domain-containing protein [bacterium]|nr:DUF177 domain-containing protein [bacterium]